MVAFSLCGSRQHLGSDTRTRTRGRHALQSRRPVDRREDDRVVRPPCQAARSGIQTGDRHRCATGDGHSLKRLAPDDEADPLAVRGYDRRAQAGAVGRNRHRLERVQRADEQLRAVVPDVDDAPPVGGDGDVAIQTVDRHRGGAGRHDRHARGVWPGRQAPGRPQHEQQRSAECTGDDPGQHARPI